MAQKIRIAEMCVVKGFITELQLQSALQRQLIMGGRIGTNLIELGYVSEEQLCEVLSDTFKVPNISDKSFQNIPQDVISMVSREFAIKHQLIPVKKELKRLTVAMENPGNIVVIDELAFITSCRIIPLVAAEIRIDFELERYYGHPKDVRYIKITGINKGEFSIERETDVYQGLRDGAEKAEQKSTADAGWFSSGDEETGYFGTGAPEFAAQPSAKNHVVPISLDNTISGLANVDSRDSAITAVIDYLAQNMENVIFFVVSVAEARSLNFRCKESRSGEFKISFGGPSVFMKVKDSEAAYFGHISSFPFDDTFLIDIGQKRPLTVLVIPVKVKHRLVGMLYVDNGGKEFNQTMVNEIHALVEKLSLAFEILLLRKKQK